MLTGDVDADPGFHPLVLSAADAARLSCPWARPTPCRGSPSPDPFLETLLISARDLSSLPSFKK